MLAPSKVVSVNFLPVPTYSVKGVKPRFSLLTALAQYVESGIGEAYAFASIV